MIVCLIFQALKQLIKCKDVTTKVQEHAAFINLSTARQLLGWAVISLLRNSNWVNQETGQLSYILQTLGFANLRKPSQTPFAHDGNAPASHALSCPYHSGNPRWSVLQRSPCCGICYQLHCKHVLLDYTYRRIQLESKAVAMPAKHGPVCQLYSHKNDTF